MALDDKHWLTALEQAELALKAFVKMDSAATRAVLEKARLHLIELPSVPDGRPFPLNLVASSELQPAIEGHPAHATAMVELRVRGLLEALAVCLHVAAAIGVLQTW